MLELINVSVTLDGNDGKVEVLKDISLSLEDKKIYVMTGPNGGGKTSLAKAIMGIYQASAGKILLDGMDITHMGIDERARLGIGYAFQQPPRFKGLTVRDMLRLAAGPGNPINECELLYDVGLCAQDYLDREMNASLSGGEIKRIEIASILARRLKFVVFDEPEAGIDLWSFQRLTETFEKLHDKYDTTIVIISHQERILRLASQVIMVENGSISEITSHEKIFGEIGRIDSECMCRRSCTREGRANVECHR
ncbi:ABC-type transport system involved in Fe-S cluster assembly, ATPase component [Peptoclostridium acidaminophilum DSM 3953]|uniref:ABC-type transport system involved in Fe-S cluster assembly, ATPase component n=1 Tax=Peptoclostridium acidaminophilum DSM 3953 TaxID=1286171 RepID=W8T2V1_PEPAC|nr:ATP-binding cassette domain-containing protein [Peptoclostridium acidaminophilum]AHM56074.1 ABC-type transport system involved in Fe-S cluster assembly, ATPase component [Peptoclostridium acidaminophilum DSM 3953]